ncbi:MAG: 4Fe-4S ferredoxin [Armatimonadetes bacterium CG_4_9_14_3_um_filter_66_14]|nr:4Fe-4S ferredoxin [Armatimonadota bacterium]PJB71744.1 MAG: 4Fe-4S ferredoxin [Armatimonadetes bacterium CG_4_9_14_3_um_filter_66_14]
MVRQIVKIDEELCDGCGLCAPSCAEGAIQIIDGKARLVGENLCDGLGACLGECPQGAITVAEREADEFDESAVERHLTASGHAPTTPDHAHASHFHTSPDNGGAHVHEHTHGGETMTAAEAHALEHARGGCPGARMMSFDDHDHADHTGDDGGTRPSQLRQWPVQLHLVGPQAPYFQGADVLLAADCVAFAIGDFHKDHLKGNSLAIACPKLDEGQEVYRQKLTALVDDAKINTLTVMTMEVPCCYGLLQLAKDAVEQASRKIPIKSKVVSRRGDILSEEWA